MEKSKEKTYWKVNESDIDKRLVEKIKRNQQISTFIAYFLLICNCIFLVLLCLRKYLSDTAFLVFVIIDALVCLGSLITEIIVATNLKKIKKEVLKGQEKG